MADVSHQDEWQAPRSSARRQRPWGDSTGKYLHTLVDGPQHAPANAATVMEMPRSEAPSGTCRPYLIGRRSPPPCSEVTSEEASEQVWWQAEMKSIEARLQKLKTASLAKSHGEALSAPQSARDSLPRTCNASRKTVVRRSLTARLRSDLCGGDSSSSTSPHCDVRDAREAAAREFNKFANWQLSEIKQMKRPVAAIRQTLEAIWLLLKCDWVENNGGPAPFFTDGKKSWQRCLRMLAEESFSSRIARFELHRLDAAPRVTQYLFLITLGIPEESTAHLFGHQPKCTSPRGSGGAKQIDPDAVSRAHAPCGSLLRWLTLVLAEYGTRRKEAPREDKHFEAETPAEEKKVEHALPSMLLPAPEPETRVPVATVASSASIDMEDHLSPRIRRNRLSMQRRPNSRTGVANPVSLASIASHIELDVPLPPVSAPVQIASSEAPTRMETPTRPESRTGAGCGCRPQTSMDVVPPELAPLKSRWTDSVDNRPKRAEMAPGPLYLLMQAAATAQYQRTLGRQSMQVVLREESPPEEWGNALLQLSVSFNKCAGELLENNLQVSATLRRLAGLVRPCREWCPKLRLEGHRAADEPKGVESERALAVYRWLVDHNHAEPGVLRLRAKTLTKADKCVIIRPIKELVVVSGPAQTEIIGTPPPGLYFEFSQSMFTEATIAVLETMSVWLQSEDQCGIPITVEGHADSSESDISLARARAVRDALVFRGVSSERFRVQACHAWHPLSRSSPSLNRRAEVHLC